MDDPYHRDRAAQARTYDIALAELRRGGKRSHYASLVEGDDGQHNLIWSR
jgi:uncharacterized protein (DUF1810 family)